jgi:hypothetical protein
MMPTPRLGYLLTMGGCGSQNVYQFVYTRDVQLLLVGLCFAGCIPACGYFGAKERSKPLLSLFTCCNGCAMCMFATSIVMIVVVMSVLNAKFSLGTEHESLMEVINNALPEMKMCCKELVDADFAATFQGCHVAALDADVYPVGAPLCPTEDDPSDGSDGSSAASDAFCLDSNSCTGIEKIGSDVQLSNVMFCALIALYILACIPATIGCCSGQQLLGSPIMNGGPAPFAGQGVAVNTPYGGRVSATGGYGK